MSNKKRSKTISIYEDTYNIILKKKLELSNELGKQLSWDEYFNQDEEVILES